MNLHDWMMQDGKKILIADKISTANRMIRSDNRKTGSIARGVEVVTLEMLAKNLLSAWLAYQGSKTEPQVLSDAGAQYLFGQMMDQMEEEELSVYLKKECRSMESYHAFYHIAELMRMGEVKSDAADAALGEKIDRLQQLVKRYEQLLLQKGCYDRVRLYRECNTILDGLDASPGLSKRLLMNWNRQIMMGYLDVSEKKWYGAEKTFFQKMAAPEDGLDITVHPILFAPPDSTG